MYKLTFPKLSGKYTDIKSAISNSKLVYFNEKEYKEIWANRFVSFVDLMGFASKSYKSLPSTLNSIVRFHRAINFCKPSFRGKFYHFTDAVYFVSESIEDCVNFSITAMNVCTAMNSEILSRRNPLAHMLLLPRITIGHGNVIDSDKLINKDFLENIDPRDFLAGDGICDAYFCEKSGFAYSIIVSKKASKYFNEYRNLVVDTKKMENGYNFWNENFVDETKDMILAWPFIRAIHEIDGTKYLRLNENLVFEELHRELMKIQYNLESGYIMENDKFDVGKHCAGLRRFVYQLESARSKCRYSEKIFKIMFQTDQYLKCKSIPTSNGYQNDVA